jgi:kynurenine formamidase
MSRFIALSHVFEDGGDPARPAHSWLLEPDIFIVENLCNLAALPAGAPFRLFAVPIRAFAELSS